MSKRFSISALHFRTPRNMEQWQYTVKSRFESPHTERYDITVTLLTCIRKASCSNLGVKASFPEFFVVFPSISTRTVSRFRSITLFTSQPHIDATCRVWDVEESWNKHERNNTAQATDDSDKNCCDFTQSRRKNYERLRRKGCQLPPFTSSSAHYAWF